MSCDLSFHASQKPSLFFGCTRQGGTRAHATWSSRELDRPSVGILPDEYAETSSAQRDAGTVLLSLLLLFDAKGSHDGIFVAVSRTRSYFVSCHRAPASHINFFLALVRVFSPLVWHGRTTPTSSSSRCSTIWATCPSLPSPGLDVSRATSPESTRREAVVPPLQSQVRSASPLPLRIG